MSRKGRNHLWQIAVVVAVILPANGSSLTVAQQTDNRPHRQDHIDAEILRLIKKLKSAEPKDGWGIFKQLRRIGPRARSSIPAVIEAIQIRSCWDDTPMRDILRQIGKPAVPHLVQAIKHKNANIGPGA